MSSPSLLRFLLSIPPSDKVFTTNTLVEIPLDDFGLHFSKMTNCTSYMKAIYNRDSPISRQEYINILLVWICKISLLLSVSEFCKSSPPIGHYPSKRLAYILRTLEFRLPLLVPEGLSFGT